MRLTLPERALLVKLYYLNKCNASAALREFRTRHKLRRGPLSLNGLKNMVTKFEETGSLTIRARRGRKPVSEEVITDVATAIVEGSQGTIAGSSSARGVARQLDMNYSTVWRVLRRVIRFYPYKITRLHELKPSDYDKRVTFALSFLARMEIDDDFPWRILWGDECHFHLNGSVNNQNSRIWASEQPHTVHEIPLHSPKVTVWCGFTAEFMIGPFFFETVTPTGPKTCTVNAQKYHEMLNTFVIPQLQHRNCLHQTIFMQDGAPPHIGIKVKQLLHQHFTHDRVISRGFPTEWPPRSPDLTPCDFWLWSYLKSKVYVGGVRNLAILKDNISQTVQNIPRDMLSTAVENAVQRMYGVISENGNHIECGLIPRQGNECNE